MTQEEIALCFIHAIRVRREQYGAESLYDNESYIAGLRHGLALMLGAEEARVMLRNAGEQE